MFPPAVWNVHDETLADGELTNNLSVQADLVLSEQLIEAPDGQCLQKLVLFFDYLSSA